MDGKRILLIVGGGIAAYKALELTRLLRKEGCAVRPILTRAGAQFVTPLSLSALSEDKVHGELFSLTDEAEMGHIELSRSADLVVVAPATADLMAKAAHGLADDLASTTLLATDKRVLMAPAMNVRMWEHPATQRNLATLRADGVLFVGPDPGAMACGEFGMGRLAEPTAILEAIRAALAGDDQPLRGRRAIVTAGPTIEPIDPVRLLTNRSSGKQGYAIAAELAALGCEVTLVSGPTALPAPAGVRRVDVETAREMLAACEAALPADIAVCVAAVADWRPETTGTLKLKKGEAAVAPTLALVENPDILATLSRGERRPRLVVGFAAETNDVEAHARAKLGRKGCDWIVANDVSVAGTMGGDENAVAIVSSQGVERWERTAKSAVARKLARRIAKELS
ncbi:MAG: bifunctional phosphopantothenoylcysteine decarboxylase/phosphopantothenate--cysteine ligase CoaBC [Phenylobacterium sp.]|uniref:bifunctional phosphopantothenoylcysteine decarboxylase/phosphopantothenate--cysteine ligase CoaBC n=1 Tax=Phenylobacterium sp. TaxID=1871053 RepID=UPI002733FA4D|nr:bifunctional phosphopantothenoylcysteine decarboxylase/phosphopantothenate--cysteine ligase CoaBC [Phenylobacterium sp.]MDP3173962.1 bifunctional phosphopantothenoylcysteine decarboxylase/phosphopantothenate--cysteine ligase CoaBC [Phenylobacterium sp.]